MIWFKIISHEYADLHPEIKYRLFKDDAEATEYAKYMGNWISGSLTLLHATKKEILEYIQRFNINLTESLQQSINNDNYYC